MAFALIRLLGEQFEIVEVVEDGERLIERSDELLPDLIVADVTLRGRDGLSAAAEIRRRHTTVPIVIISASLDPALSERALAVGVNAFVHKSDLGNRLLHVLRQLARIDN